jgi:hypothetical protein
VVAVQEVMAAWHVMGWVAERSCSGVLIQGCHMVFQIDRLGEGE